MKTNHIYKYALETSFFQVVTSGREIKKVVRDGKPAIEWDEDENTTTWWTYDDEEYRDNDYDVVTSYIN